jgi:hypothetical protein
LREGIITLQDGHLFIYDISNVIQAKEMGALTFPSNRAILLKGTLSYLVQSH